MKTYIISLMILFLTACEEYQPNHQHLSVIIDLTDTDSYRPRPEELLSHLHTAHESDGLSLYLRYVAETRYASRQLFSLAKGETGLLSNEDQRRRKRKALFQRFSDTLTAENSKQKELPRSEILRLVADELSELSKQTGDRKLLLYSNLQEHSDLISLYRPKDQERILRSPKKVAASLVKKLSLPNDLSGIAIHIRYTPTLEDDKYYTAMVQLYRELLEPLGATLIVGMDNHIKL